MLYAPTTPYQAPCCIPGSVVNIIPDMLCSRREITLQGTPETDVHDVTAEVQAAVAESGVKEGVVVVFTPGSTAAVTTIEYEPGAVSDLVRALREIAPEQREYAHNARWGDGNGYSHLRAALLGPSVSIPVAGGKVVLGTWQQVVVLDFDNKARRRRVVMQVVGTG